jgi:phosphoribosyl 1,2-cyclic phosphate phosphodiesterase
MREPILNMFCSKSVCEKLGRIPEGIDVTVVKAFDNFSVEKYNIVALPARHTKAESEPLNYIVSADKTILYAHDTGYFFDETFDYIKENKIRFDLVSLDCTHVDNITSDTGRHMGLDNVSRVIKRLQSIDALDGNSKCYVNHFSHNGNPLHERVCDLAAKIGCKAAYDGLSVDI